MVVTNSYGRIALMLMLSITYVTVGHKFFEGQSNVVRTAVPIVTVGLSTVWLNMLLLKFVEIIRSFESPLPGDMSAVQWLNLAIVRNYSPSDLERMLFEVQRGDAEKTKLAAKVLEKRQRLTIRHKAEWEALRIRAEKIDADIARLIALGVFTAENYLDPQNDFSTMADKSFASYRAVFDALERDLQQCFARVGQLETVQKDGAAVEHAWRMHMVHAGWKAADEVFSSTHRKEFLRTRADEYGCREEVDKLLALNWFGAAEQEIEVARTLYERKSELEALRTEVANFRSDKRFTAESLLRDVETNIRWGREFRKARHKLRKFLDA